ncbi:MAG TPA: hypothetical protein VJA21_11325 [Verrucomicrobiae bacterium]
MLDWFRVEYTIGKLSSKLRAVTELDCATWVIEVKPIRGKKLPLTAAGPEARKAITRYEVTGLEHPGRADAPMTWTVELPKDRRQLEGALRGEVFSRDGANGHDSDGAECDI